MCVFKERERMISIGEEEFERNISEGKLEHCAAFHVITAVVMKSFIFWNITP
jgi:hypothetical protein